VGTGRVSQIDVERGQGLLLLAVGAGVNGPPRMPAGVPGGPGVLVSLHHHMLLGKAQTPWVKGRQMYMCLGHINLLIVLII